MSLANWIEHHPETIERIGWALQHATTPLSPAERDMGPFHRLARRVLPGNWLELRIGARERVERTMRDTGICLVWVPRPEVVLALIRCATKEERDACLVEHWDEILDDVEAALADSSHPKLDPLPAWASQALTTARSGCDFPAQTACAALLGSVLEGHFGIDGFEPARVAFEAQSPHAVDIRLQRRAWIQWSIRTSILRSQDPDRPDSFNRHLTAHGTEDQFSRAHTLAGLMLIAGALRELHEIYSIRDHRLPPHGPWPDPK
jgi:hypothetical protein